MEKELILAINPGSTSTKIAIYQGEKEVFTTNISHPKEELDKCSGLSDQLSLRLNVIEKELGNKDIDIKKLVAIVGRGGLLEPVTSGTYEINERMLADLKSNQYGEHASNLGAQIASKLAEQLGIKGYIVDPVVVDELSPVARISGMAGVERKSIFHALNQKAVAKRYSESRGKDYDNTRLIVAHLGGGISVGLHIDGKVIDVNNALDGEGPFSPERSGGVPIVSAIREFISDDYDIGKFKKKVKGLGGLMGYLGTTDTRKLVEVAKAGDRKSELILEAMIYQVAKEIGGLASVACGQLDAVIVTGGIAYSDYLMEKLKKYISYLGEIVIYPGEDEMEALVRGLLRVTSGMESAKKY